jgi:hypothetical protein
MDSNDLTFSTIVFPSLYAGAIKLKLGAFGLEAIME